MYTCVLYNAKEKRHFVVRVIEKCQLAWSWSGECSAELNKLISSKTPQQLLDAIDSFPALYPQESFLDKKIAYSLMDAKDELRKSRYVSCKKETLEAEMYLASATPLRANKESFESFILKYGTNGQDYLTDLREVSESEHFVLMEPVQDWMMLRNTLSICARVLGQIQDEEKQESLEDAGFSFRDNTRIKKEIYYTPFKYNTFFNTSSGQMFEQDALFTALTKRKYERTTIPFFLDINVDYFSEIERDVFVLTRPLATQKYDMIQSLKQEFLSESTGPVETRTHYLCLRNTGDQREMMEGIIEAFSSAFRSLTDSTEAKGKKRGTGSFLGWKYDQSGEYEKLEEPRLVPQSFISALWYQLVYHPGKRITICKLCKNAVLTNEQGTKNKYCSNSCRVRDSRKRKKEQNDDKGSPE